MKPNLSPIGDPSDPVGSRIRAMEPEEVRKTLPLLLTDVQLARYFLFAVRLSRKEAAEPLAGQTGSPEDVVYRAVADVHSGSSLIAIDVSIAGQSAGGISDQEAFVTTLRRGLYRRIGELVRSRRSVVAPSSNRGRRDPAGR